MGGRRRARVSSVRRGLARFNPRFNPRCARVGSVRRGLERTRLTRLHRRARLRREIGPRSTSRSDEIFEIGTRSTSRSDELFEIAQMQRLLPEVHRRE